MKAARSIIKGQVVSEKGTWLAEKANQYLFNVDPRANKIEIRKAIEEIFKVKVVGISTSNVQGKWKRVRQVPGRTSAWKKAFVRLKAGDKIEVV
jgi:large subunit ribosomal protein L23